MALNDNERIQEVVLMAQEKTQAVGTKVWYALGITIVAMVPAYYLLKFGFISIMMQTHREPQVIYSDEDKQPLEVLESKIFTLAPNTYAGYVKIRNIEYEWGVRRQEYTAEFKTVGGTVLTRVDGSTFILPSSDKIIVFSRFTHEQTPQEIVFRLGETKFSHAPEINVDLDIQRTEITHPASGTIVYAGVKNNSPYTLKRVDLPVILYGNNNQVLGVGSTIINDLVSNETRTFQYSWPSRLQGVVRAEISYEVNVFDREIFGLPPESSPIDGRDE
ncbi:MAG: hypothetical protein A3I07_04295 [Candidatus Doudnabacteria bacterium RIFCSPLOWO2_02_FULL_42_9]|uniref:Uncharacterized protein n=1 Tax=Candidatus Doudnabacteria bacterium RIFCSPHIGHO2_01_FULL_41_86 TaxID=1817821 RepID=A0A1F5N7U2_9BACT|nr:MAG: hypothetical protein A2717_03810 [Candidatus Doudnabacteria bacterium RIFCSPHIGHO2_01_FULL_41_86]OGE74795.1 MAG: hypothetical protein A3K07_03405 [Candidatus Doudnabacteria bacterium RIFCSPHIGHO2_01_43_10]OGE85762.1 MAG: hypothetical protein A3E28_03140 [Candidatus Doudnabacteria bacterium RIFCSPHIGHO2_12_FULL_42_22]OGE87257.1 MAG: hypothetical protein A3C49_00765 [Candidatus Doudnabacteria bacterium RIFCSPHIGHO2_02_FULL_42_25]OGE92094.1 MAG: hypothetical protein A2895_00640 [Candidatus